MTTPTKPKKPSIDALNCKINNVSRYTGENRILIDSLIEGNETLASKLTLVFWFACITTAISTALAITALICK